MWDGFDPLYPFFGLLVGAMIGMTGVGGGSLMTPLLILLFGIHPALAVGTDLLYAAATKSVGTVTHGLARTVEWKIVWRLALGSVPATMLTLWWLSNANLESEEVGSLITYVLGWALLLTSVSLFVRVCFRGAAFSYFENIGPEYRFAATIVTGALLGVLVSMTSVGAGALGVVLLIALYPKLPMARIVGSDVAHAVPLTLIGGIGHWQLGSVDASLLLSLLLGSVPGVLIGSIAAARFPETVIRLVLAVVLAAVSLRLLLGG